MSRSVRTNYDQLINLTAMEPMMCEADERNQQALFILETEWGCGRIDIGKLQRILRGDHKEEPCAA